MSMITRRRVLSRGALAAGGAALLDRFASVFTGTARARPTSMLRSRRCHGLVPASSLPGQEACRTRRW